MYCIVLIFLLVNVGLLRNYAILSFDEGAVLQHTFVIFIVSADVALTGLRAAKLLLKGAVQTPHELHDTRKFQKIGNLRTALRDFYAIRPQFIQKVKLDGGVSYMYYIIEKKSAIYRLFRTVKIVEKKEQLKNIYMFLDLFRTKIVNVRAITSFLLFFLEVAFDQ